MAKNILVNNNSVYVEITEKTAGCFELYWHDWVVNEWRQDFDSKEKAIQFIKQEILEGVEQVWIS